jgi:hypothetical protein
LSDVPSDIIPAARGDVRRLTYAELAAVRGISRASAERLARRKHWPRQVGNDGVTRVTVPLADAAPSGPRNVVDNPPDHPPNHPPPDKADRATAATPDILAAIREVITPLAAALEYERARADRLEIALADATAAERIASSEALMLRTREDERRRWRFLRRLRWASSAR